MAQMVKNLTVMKQTQVHSLGLTGEGSESLLQYSCLENSMDRGDCQAIVYGAAKSQTQLRD